jgi:hypothetical protein
VSDKQSITDPEWIDVVVTVTWSLQIAKGTEKMVLDTIGYAVANAGSYPARWPMYSFQTPIPLGDVKATLQELVP